jgi:uncharacterized repeat protein (TIGR01451 family)
MKRFRTFGLALSGLVLMVLAATPALAAGTGAGVTISNQATLDYAVGGVNQPDLNSDGNSNPADGAEPTTFLVDNRVDLTMTGTDNAAASGTGQLLTFTIENTGNETQGYALDLYTGANATDDTIDMSNVAIYLDLDKSGTINVGDTLYAKGSGDNVADVPANNGASSIIQILVQADVPAGAVTGDTASYTLRATTLDAGTTAPTAATTGADDPTAVDVVLADAAALSAVSTAPADVVENGQYNATATYTVQAAQLAISKTAAVISDPINGAVNPKAVPGATVRYTITITNSGAAAADSVVMTDPIPANTNFLVGTVTDSTTTGTISYDNGAVTFTYAPVDGGDGSDPSVTAVRVSIPTIAGSGGSATITFDVLIE